MPLYYSLYPFVLIFISIVCLLAFCAPSHTLSCLVCLLELLLGIFEFDAGKRTNTLKFAII